jgi:hypothetical protein
MNKIEMIGAPVNVHTEDGGIALIVEVHGPGTSFCRIQSWDEYAKEHADLGTLPRAKLVKVTIEWEV